jgi:quercetin dioxygenase-like cupin family protein
MTIAQLVLLAPGEGREISVLGDRYTFKALSPDTGGAYALWETTTPAGAGGPPAHVHQHEDEAFYVLAGELTFQIGERVLRGAAGTFVLAPRGIAHKFSNHTSEPAKMLVIVSPGGFENALEDLSQFAARGDQPPDMEKLLAVADKYGLKIVGPG